MVRFFGIVALALFLGACADQQTQGSGGIYVPSAQQVGERQLSRALRRYQGRTRGTTTTLNPRNYHVRVYRHMDVFPFRGTQEDACRLLGVTPCSRVGIERACPLEYVENGSFLFRMTDTVRGVNKVNPDGSVFRMALERGDPKTNHRAWVCSPFPNGWVILKFKGCGNYVYTPRAWLRIRGQQPVRPSPAAEYRPSYPVFYSNTQAPFLYAPGVGYGGIGVLGGGSNIRENVVQGGSVSSAASAAVARAGAGR